MLDIGQSEDWLALQMALAPCLLGYGAVAKMLHGDVKTKKEGNHYWNWIENYVADDYVQAVNTGSGMSGPELLLRLPARSAPLIRNSLAMLERNALLQSPSRIEELVKIFIHATKVGEAMFIHEASN